MSRQTVAPAAHCCQQVASACQFDSPHDVRYFRATDNESRMTVKGAIPDEALQLICTVSGQDDLTVQVRGPLANRGGIKRSGLLDVLLGPKPPAHGDEGRGRQRSKSSRASLEELP